jgi:DNA helicase-2/ATP-dependent DNA helicase PcrA
LDKQAVRGEDWFKDQLYELKKKFWKSGFATYQDVELICLKLLQEKKSIRELLAKRFPYIIVDECQDLSWIQLKIFETLINTGVKIHLVGDPNQAIYEFKKVDPKKVINFISTNKYKIQYLTENYRSNQRIVNLSQKLIAGKKISGKETSVNSISCICINFKKEKVKELIPWFECRLEKEGLLSKKAAVVARGWSMISKLRACGNNFLLKKQEKLITSIYLWKNHNRIARKDALFYFGEFVASHFFPKHNFLKRQFFCPEIFKPCYLWRIFLSRVLEDVTEEGCSIGDFSETWRAWAGNFRDSIIAVLNKHKKVLPSSDFEFSSFRFRALNGHSTDKVIETIPFKFDGDDCKIRTTTIHQVKGETVDALMLVSSLDKRGATKDGHWSFWLEDSSSEKARLAYVASSRPKHLLVWAVADASKGDVNRLKDMGFSIMDLR